MQVDVHRSIDEVDAAQWNHVASTADLGSVFHRVEWLRAVEAGVHNRAIHAVVQKDGNPIAIFPNFTVDIGPTPFRRLISATPGFGGPAVLTDERAALEVLFDAVRDTCGGRIITHFVKPSSVANVRYQRFLERRGYQPSVPSCRFMLDLTQGWETIHERMDGSRRRALRQGREQSHEVTHAPVEEATLQAFYRDYEQVMERVGGDAHAWAFFRRLSALEEHVKVLALSVGGEPAGRLLFLLDAERGTMHYLFSAVTRDHFEYNASELLHAAAIRWAINQEYERYDFGETAPDFEDGLFTFKERFGGQIVPTLAWECGCAPVRWQAFRAARALYRRTIAGDSN